MNFGGPELRPATPEGWYADPGWYRAALVGRHSMDRSLPT